jgi:lipoprotein-anchoring transpeptidase ErfK/SrfK
MKSRGLRIPVFLLGMLALILFLGSVGLPRQAQAANVEVSIDISQQTMGVWVAGIPIHNWPVSTAKPGYRTPIGTFKPIRLEQVWYSTKYDYAPMPYSIFFHGGYAIHGTESIRSLGKPVSHGCIRLHPDNARKLFNLVLKNGRAATTIRIKP